MKVYAYLAVLAASTPALSQPVEINVFGTTQYYNETIDDAVNVSPPGDNFTVQSESFLWTGVCAAGEADQRCKMPRVNGNWFSYRGDMGNVNGRVSRILTISTESFDPNREYKVSVVQPYDLKTGKYEGTYVTLEIACGGFWEEKGHMTEVAVQLDKRYTKYETIGTWHKRERVYAEARFKPAQCAYPRFLIILNSGGLHDLALEAVEVTILQAD